MKFPAYYGTQMFITVITEKNTATTYPFTSYTKQQMHKMFLKNEKGIF
jgi:hypothetical protein